jgi:4-hydroxy-tetrahydrodipicolinate synthase
MTSRTFSGLSAFPLTPLTDDGVNEGEYVALVRSLAEAGVDSIGALGSTGSYAYLSRAERARAATLAVQAANGTPVIVGIGAIRTRDVLAHLEDAQTAGAAGVLLAPLTYQPLTDDEVFGLYADVAPNSSVPIVVYDNPSTTRVTFSDDLHARIAHLDGIASIKIPAVSADPAEARARIDRLRAVIPEHVGIGVSGDGAGADGLIAGCDAWYSVLAGLLPEPCLAIVRAVAEGDHERARALSDGLTPVWDLFARYGSYRVVAAIAEDLGRVAPGVLPRPVQGLDAEGRSAVSAALAAIGVRG